MELVLLGALIWMLAAGSGAAHGAAGAVRGALADAPRKASKERQNWLTKNKDAPALVRAAHRGGVVVGAVRHGPRAVRDGWLGGWRSGNDRVRDWADRHTEYVYNRPEPEPATTAPSTPKPAGPAGSTPPTKNTPPAKVATPPAGRAAGRARLRSVPNPGGTGTTVSQEGTTMARITTAYQGIVHTTTMNLAEADSVLAEDRDELEEAARAWNWAQTMAQQNQVWGDALARHGAPREWQGWVQTLIEHDRRIKEAEAARLRAADDAVHAAVKQRRAAVDDHALIGHAVGPWYQ